MKKILSCILAICLIVPFAFMLSGCGEQAPMSTVTLSVNPELTLVLDNNNKVLSVSYGNADAGLVFADVNFLGMDIDSAVETFIKQSAVSGHLYLDGEDFVLEVNGLNEEKITELNQKVKTKVEDMFETLGVEVVVNVTDLNEEARRSALFAMASLLAPENNRDELESMTTEELLKLINDKQKQFEGLVYSQIVEIRDHFSVAQNSLMQAIQQAKASIYNVKAEIEELIDGLEIVPEILKAQIKILNQTIDSLNEEVEGLLKQFSEQFQAKINEAKAELSAVKEDLVNSFKDQVAIAEDGFMDHLNEAKANGVISQEEYDYWKSLVEKY